MISNHLEEILELELSPEIKEEVERSLSLITFSKGETILREGDQARHLYIILTGVVRGYYIDEAGNDITKCFGCECGFFSTEGFRTGAAATFTIECLEDCQSIRIPYAWLNQLLLEKPAINTKIRQMFQQEIQVQERRNRNLVLLDAEARYVDFCETFPQLAERVPLGCVASYIGIRLGSLSRIRKQLHLT